MTPDQDQSLLKLLANLQATIAHLLEENTRLVEELQQPCGACVAAEKEEAEAACCPPCETCGVPLGDHGTNPQSCG